MAYYHTVSLDDHCIDIIKIVCFSFQNHLIFEPPPPKLKSYREAMSAIENAQAFLDIKGHNGISTKLKLEISSIVLLKCASCTKQTTIDNLIKCCNKDTLRQGKTTQYRLLKHQRLLRQFLVNFQLRTSKLEVDNFALALVTICLLVLYKTKQTVQVKKPVTDLPWF